MIALHHVRKSFPMSGRGPVVALDDIELTVRPGEFVTVTGPSGSGKSTLLFTIGAMLAPTEGSVRMDGEDVYRLGHARRAAIRRTSIGFVFQTFNLVPYLTCLENVSLVSALSGKSRREADRAAAELLARLGLGQRLDHRPGALSVGERQRAALARSVMNSPKVLLADEPTGNLDDTTADEVMKLLLAQRSSGRSVLMATHDRTLAEMGTRVLSIEAGRISGDRRAHGSGATTC